MHALIRNAQWEDTYAIAVSEDLEALKKEACDDAEALNIIITSSHWKGDKSPYVYGRQSDGTLSVTYYIREIKVV